MLSLVMSRQGHLEQRMGEGGKDVREAYILPIGIVNAQYSRVLDLLLFWYNDHSLRNHDFFRFQCSSLDTGIHRLRRNAIEFGEV